jgi:hypothetical protein
MSRKVFTAGEVLAAADVNSFLMDQTVMSFAGTAARGSAIPSPVEGMYTHLEDRDRLEFYNGSSWLASSGLNLIKKESGTAVTAISVNNCFSALYNNYRIIFNGTISAGAISFRLRNAGTDDSTNNYRQSRFDQVATTLSGSRDVNQPQWGNIFLPIGVTNHNALEISNPFQTSVTVGENARVEAPDGNLVQTRFVLGLNTTLSYDGFSLINVGGNITGTVLVYGYNLG